MHGSLSHAVFAFTLMNGIEKAKEKTKSEKDPDDKMSVMCFILKKN